jgi:Spy/CpxP family protein refolding chaperone
MSIFNRNKTSFWIIGVLVLLNLGTLGFIWLMPPPPAPGEIVGPLMEKRLELRKEQREAFREERRAHFQKRRVLLDEAQESRRQLIEVLSRAPVDSMQVEKLLEQLSGHHNLLEEEFVRHYLRLRDICDEQQQVRLEELFNRGLRFPGMPDPPDRK